MRCRVCGESWSLDSAHEAISEFHGEEVEKLRDKCGGRNETWKHTNPFQAQYEEKYFNPMVQKFNAEGCRAFDPGASYCVPDEKTADRSFVLAAMSEVMGDDCDGMESMLEDADRWGLL